ncbi:MAG: hypothetical protein KAQ63_01015 [Candidatus Moranbacteria bacterium]|nr:hypothetical protein [Candidatus Moranbacteria bacterium]
MPRRNLENRNIRKIFKSGKCYCISLPIGMVRELKWREKQKLQVKRVRGGLSVKDWKK